MYFSEKPCWEMNSLSVNVSEWQELYLQCNKWTIMVICCLDVCTHTWLSQLFTVTQNQTLPFDSEMKVIFHHLSTLIKNVISWSVYRTAEFLFIFVSLGKLAFCTWIFNTICMSLWAQTFDLSREIRQKGIKNHSNEDVSRIRPWIEEALYYLSHHITLILVCLM